MTWTPDGPRDYEQDKIAAIALQYLHGFTLDLGCGDRKVWPFCTGVDNGSVFGAHNSAVDIRCDISKLTVFADECADSVFSSHAIEDFPREKVPALLREWRRVLKTGGHLVLYVPSANLYPKVGQPGANTMHQWDIYPGDIEAILKEIDGWELLESEERGEGNEYSLFIVAKKLESGWKENIWQRNPGGKKRVLIGRYGAIGDQIMTSSILPGLKAQGYHITYMTQPISQEVLLHDPNIDEWYIQDKDACPNEQLGPFWDTIAQRYDRFINLSESIEGGLLTLPGRLQHQYPTAVRQKLFSSVNYLERTHDIAGVPLDFACKFYATEQEMKWARALKRAWGGPVVTWAINGSSPHKVYPFAPIVVRWLLERTPLHVCLLSDPGIGKVLQDAIVERLEEEGVEMSRLHPMGGGTWSIRQALTFCQVSDCVVGPETGPLNSVCFEPMPKVIYLSHSSAENLTKYWKNTTVLEPDVKDAPCFPCMRLHYNWDHCHQHPETHAALCATSIKPEALFEAIALAMGAKRKEAA